ncbi:MAG: N-6 DNA methylase [Betaproteobacteria bacterium]|jgi:hypothetical protein|nr:N-6 DNA methylase [Betaproteobacteria bacterium]
MIEKNASTAVQGAFWRLMDITHKSHSIESGWLFALTWLAVGRLACPHTGAPLIPVNEMLTKEAWDGLPEDLVPDEARDMVWRRDYEQSSRIEALKIVSELIEHHAGQGWDVIDAAWGSGDRYLQGGLVLSPELCDLLMGAIDPPEGASLWLPFDSAGQLSLRALRRGMRVIVDGPGRRNETPLRLLIALEGIPEEMLSRVVFKVEAGSDGSRSIQPDYLIAIPPFNEKIQPGAGWRQWEASGDSAMEGITARYGPISKVQLERSEGWAIAALWPRVQKKAVYVVPPSVLFARGQEERLRESLILNGAPIESVTMLPSRQFGGTTISTAMMVMSRVPARRSIRLVDASSMTDDVKSSMRSSKALRVNDVLGLLTGPLAEDHLACDAEISQIEAQDFNLLPARYMGASAMAAAGPHRALGELVTIIRPPPVVKDQGAVLVREAGFAELDKWSPVATGFAKTATIQSRKLEQAMLREDDILLSIKGTLGKTAILGAIPADPAWVKRGLGLRSEDISEVDLAAAPIIASQSCIALRVDKSVCDPLALFLFLRSDSFKSQIEALRVGAVIAHVTPTTLLKAIQVPVSAIEAQVSSSGSRYEELCRLERLIEDSQRQIEDIRATLGGVLHE